MILHVGYRRERDLVEKAKREDRFCLLFDDETHRFFYVNEFLLTRRV